MPLVLAQREKISYALRFSESAFLLHRQAVSNKPSVLIMFIEQLSVNVRALLTVVLADISSKGSATNVTALSLVLSSVVPVIG